MGMPDPPLPAPPKVLPELPFPADAPPLPLPLLPVPPVVALLPPDPGFALPPVEPDHMGSPPSGFFPMVPEHASVATRSGMDDRERNRVEPG